MDDSGRSLDPEFTSKETKNILPTAVCSCLLIMTRAESILIVDDERGIRDTLARA